MDAATLSAIAAMIAAIVGFINSVQNIMLARDARANRRAIQTVDGKVDVVSENVDGHLSKMTAIVAGIDPVTTRAVARELREEAKEEAVAVIAKAKIAADQVIKDATEPN
jgi:hypothetical protein